MKRSAVMRLDEVLALQPSIPPEVRPAEDRIFTKSEQEYCAGRPRSLAARYLVKKCVLDYLTEEKRCEVGSFSDIEIVRNELGRPSLKFFNGVSETIRALKIKEVPVSMSHSRNWIAGMVLFCS